MGDTGTMTTAGFHIEATEVLNGSTIIGYRVTVPECPGTEAFCEKPEEIITTGCALQKRNLNE
ncbi:MAG: hypothetical protein LUD12_09715 [Lachnospiraceae bacterium]|nr:hypothetical protein [Lachnospiraceae bacterium]